MTFHNPPLAGSLTWIQEEIASGDFGSLLDRLFGAATAERSAERFSDKRVPHRRNALGL